MLVRPLFSALALTALSLATPSFATTFTCSTGEIDAPPQGGEGTGPFSFLSATDQGHSDGSLSLTLQAPVAFTGTYAKPDTHGGAPQIFNVSGQIPATLVGTISEPLGSINADADITAYFGADAGKDGTKLVLEFSRPEVPEETFAATLALWAEFPDGTRAALCGGDSSDCEQTALNCETGDASAK